MPPYSRVSQTRSEYGHHPCRSRNSVGFVEENEGVDVSSTLSMEMGASSCGLCGVTLVSTSDHAENADARPRVPRKRAATAAVLGILPGVGCEVKK